MVRRIQFFTTQAVVAESAREHRRLQAQAIGAVAGARNQEGPEVQRLEPEVLELGVYLSWVKAELDNEKACLELPFSLILLVSFSCLALLHLGQSSVFTVQNALRSSVEHDARFAFSSNFAGKSFYDVVHVDDVWSWLRHGLVPLVAQQQWSYSESLQEGYRDTSPVSSFGVGQLPSSYKLRWYSEEPQPVLGDLLHYNRILGGVRLRQERSAIGYHLCRFPSALPTGLWKAWLGKPCMPADPSYELRPEVGQAQDFAKPSRDEWLLPALDSLQDLEMKLIDMEDGCQKLSLKGRPGQCFCATCSEDDRNATPWMDEQTQRVEAGFLTFNAAYGLVSYVSANFFVNRGGRITHRIYVTSSYVNHFVGPHVIVTVFSDAVWILCVLYMFVNELSEIRRTIRSTQDRWYRSIYRDYMSFWNSVDWISIAIACLVIARFARLLQSTSDFNEEFERFAGLNASSLNREEYTQMTQDLFGLAESMCSLERDYRVSFMFYPMVVLLRLFKSFDAQPRLAVLTRTLWNAAPDLLHFFLLFVAAFFCIALSAVFLFGRDVENFATMDRAVVTCFQVLVAKYDWKHLRRVGHVLAAVWLWIFVVLLALLLLQMTAAMVVDSYGDVKSSTSDMQTLRTQISEMFRRRRQFQRQERVRLSEIWEAFFGEIGDNRRMLGSRELITPEHIQRLVPGIPQVQAARTFSNAKKALEHTTRAPYGIDTVLDHLRTIERQAHFISDQIMRFRGNILKSMRCDPRIRHGPTETWRNSPDPAVQAHGAVRGAMHQLAEQLTEVLGHETIQVATRQQQLDAHQLELMITAQDTRRSMMRLRACSDVTVRRLGGAPLAQPRRAVAGPPVARLPGTQGGGLPALEGLRPTNGIAAPVHVYSGIRGHPQA